MQENEQFRGSEGSRGSVRGAESPASGAPPDALLVELRQASREELRSLLVQLGTEVDIASARTALRNPYCDSECIAILMQLRSLHSIYEFRRLITLHRHTPHAIASRFVTTLYWRDLARVGAQATLSPLLRRLADRLLIQRLDQLALGERIALARVASQGVLGTLFHQPHPRVIQALMDNPRLTEGVIMPVVASGGSSPQVLDAIAANRRWGNRYPIRLALCRNPRTPVQRAIALVAGLRRVDQRNLIRDGTVAQPVRRRARLLAEGI